MAANTPASVPGFDLKASVTLVVLPDSDSSVGLIFGLSSCRGVKQATAGQTCSGNKSSDYFSDEQMANPKFYRNSERKLLS